MSIIESKPVFPFGLQAGDQVIFDEGALNKGIFEQDPDSTFLVPTNTTGDVDSTPSAIRYNPDSDEFEGGYNQGWRVLGGGGIRWQSTVATDLSRDGELGRGYLIDNRLNQSAIVLPHPRKIGDSVSIADVFGVFSKFPFTIKAYPGDVIYGSAEDMTIATDSVSASLTWSGDEQGWVVTAGVGLGQGRVYKRGILEQLISETTSHLDLVVIPDMFDVYVDGKRLSSIQAYIDGTGMTFNPALTAGSFVQVIQYAPVQLAPEQSSLYLKRALNLSDIVDAVVARQNLSAAKSGINADITNLTALSGALRLGGDAVGAYDAVTLRQLQAAGSGGGASMTGVMNNFVGAVSWFNGSRAKLPSGCIAADGQLVNRGDAATSDLWTAVNSGMYVSTATDALWLNSGSPINPYASRGKYSPGNGTTTFRVPDLNGVQANSIGAVFLRGNNGDGVLQGPVGTIMPSRAPNVTGSFNGRMIGTAPGNGFSILPNASGAFRVGANLAGGSTGATPSADLQNMSTTEIDASRSSAVYGRLGADGSTATTEVTPNFATGIWIIRAAGAFVAANTSFNVITGDATTPANGVVATGGAMISDYQIAGASTSTAKLYSQLTLGETLSYGVIEAIKTGTGAGSSKFMFRSDGVSHSQGETRPASVMAHGGSPNRVIEPLVANGTTGYYAGSLRGAYTVFYPDNVTTPGLYVKGLDTTNPANIHYLLASKEYSIPAWEVGSSIYRTNVASGPYAYMYNNATLKIRANAAQSGGVFEYQPAVAILGQTSTLGFNSAVGFGKFTDGTNKYGYPAIVRGMADITGSDGTIGGSPSVWKFGGDATGYGIKTNSGDISPAVSDIRHKDSVKDSRPGALERINLIESKEFTWKVSGVESRGYIAQQLQTIDPLYVRENDDENKTLFVDPTAIMSDMIAAIQALSRRNTELEARLAILEGTTPSE